MFKKMCLFLMWIILLWTSFSFAYVEDFDTCSVENVTSDQENTMNKIYTIFSDYQDVIEMKYPGTNFLVQEYIEQLGLVLDCFVEIDGYEDFEFATIYLLKSIMTYDVDESNKAVDYNDALVEIQLSALAAYEEYDDLVIATDIGEDFSVVEAKRLETIEIINQLIIEISDIWSYQGDDALLVAFTKNLEVLMDSLENEEKRLIELYIWRGDMNRDFPESEILEEENLLASIAMKDDKAYTDIIEAQTLFAKKYNYELKD